jgi:hypothetical protein
VEGEVGEVAGVVFNAELDPSKQLFFLNQTYNVHISRLEGVNSDKKEHS